MDFSISVRSMQFCWLEDSIDNPYAVRDKNYRDKAIEISNVMTYAFAEYNDGTYGFWAAGKAGWFEIQSASNAYHDTYEKMIQAASMFYMLADKLKRSRNRNPKISRKRTDQYADQIFQDVCWTPIPPFLLPLKLRSTLVKGGILLFSVRWMMFERHFMSTVRS